MEPDNHPSDRQTQPPTPQTQPEPAPESPKPQLPPTTPSREKRRKSPLSILVAILLIGLIAGSLAGYALSYSVLNGRIDQLQTQLEAVTGQTGGSTSYFNNTYLLGNISLAQLYQQVQQSVVVIQNLVPQYNFFGFLQGYSQQQGSGFIASVNNQQVIVTNNHVTASSINITVTFSNGDTFPAKLAGADAYADLAVLTLTSIPSGIPSLTIVSSATLQVGDPVVAVGSPYGLAGTLTTGVVSALGRSITETSGGQNTGPTISDIIQTSTPINPGNSGGPLINYAGEVVGITTAAVSSSEGLGFAIPSETILRELNSLLTTGSYNQHPSLQVTGTDMNYQIAQVIGANITYGFLVEQTSGQNGLKGGTTQVVVVGNRILIGGDVITAIDGTRIINTDSLLSYLEQRTRPGQQINVTVLRENQLQTISVTVGTLQT